MTDANTDTNPRPWLTADEHEALELSGRLANKIRNIVGHGNQADNDWNEAATHIHVIQNMILAQAASRAYPHLYRPLGGWPVASA